MITIPSNEWQASQAGEKLGNLIRTKNIDLSESGKLKLARKCMSMFGYGAVGSGPDAVDPAFQDNIQAILTDSTYAYILTAASMFVLLLTDNLETALQTSNNGSQPSFGFDSDMTWYNGNPHVSGGAYVSKLNTGISTWNSRVISDLSTTVPHPVLGWEQGTTLLVGNGNTVLQYSNSYALDTTNSLTIPEQYLVTSIRSNGSFIYVGTRHKYAGEARMFVWNGAGNKAQSSYPCGADWIYSMRVYQSAMTIVTSAGQIGRFNGGGFTWLANFPVYYTPFSWGKSADLKSLVGRVASRGMDVAGDTIYIVADGSINNGVGVYPGTYIPEQPSGLWEYTPSNGLTHKGSVNLVPRLRMTPTEVNSSYLKFANPHGASTGDPFIAAITTLTGLNSGQVYYAIVDAGAGPTTLRAALSPADAQRGDYITIGGTITTDAFVFDRSTQMGQSVISYPGAVFALGATKPSLFYGSEVLYGAGIYDGLLNEATIMSLGMGRNIGSFVLPKIYSKDVKDVFQRVMTFFQNLYLSTDQIVIKYRILKRMGLPTPLAFSGSASWTSATTFTVSGLTKDFKSVQVGDEIEIVTGTNAGFTAHITDISLSGTTYTVTIDETMPNSSGTFDFVADNWKKLSIITKDGEDAYAGIDTSPFIDNATAKWLEMKFELRGRSVEIEQLQLMNVIHTSS